MIYVIYDYKIYFVHGNLDMHFLLDVPCYLTVNDHIEQDKNLFMTSCHYLFKDN